MAHPDLTQNTIPQFLAAFLQHLERLKTQSDHVDKFIDDYLTDGVCNQIAAAAVDKMSVTLADQREHSSALIKPPVIYDIATMPVDLNGAKNWFAKEHGSYTKFVEDMWEGFKKIARTPSIFCHVMYGWGKDGGWVHLGVWLMEENAESEPFIVPLECLSEDEKRAMGYESNSNPTDASPGIASDDNDVFSVADTITYFESRKNVESHEIDGALRFFDRLLEPGKTQRFKGRLLFGISGYDDDSRELYEIPEVRLWMQRLDAEFPYWFYFLSRVPATLEFVTFSLCDYTQTARGAEIKPNVLAAFVERHFAAMNQLCEVLGESEAEIEKLSNEVATFYFDSSPRSDKLLNQR